jgi:hypothetical protein
MMAIALLILAIPATASAQIVYQRNNDRYDRADRRDVREAINRLDSSAVQLERDLNTGRQRRVLGGLFLVSNVDNNAVVEVRNFRESVRELRRSFRGDALSIRGDALSNSADEARLVIDRGIQLDRYLRLRTGSASVDADLADLRSNLHVLAEAYGMRLRY